MSFNILPSYLSYNTQITSIGGSGIESINITGNLLSGSVIFTGVGNITVFTGDNNSIYFSGSALDNTNLELTGQSLQNQINLNSGNLTNSGVNIYNSINSLSGYLDNNFTTTGNADNRYVNVAGEEDVAGIKNFIDGIQLTGTGIIWKCPEDGVSVVVKMQKLGVGVYGLIFSGIGVN